MYCCSLHISSHRHLKQRNPLPHFPRFVPAFPRFGGLLPSTLAHLQQYASFAGGKHCGRGRVRTVSTRAPITIRLVAWQCPHVSQSSAASNSSKSGEQNGIRYTAPFILRPHLQRSINKHHQARHTGVKAGRRRRLSMPSFGFGVGDFIAVGNLAIKTYACLQDSTGSAADYQRLKLASCSFKVTIALVEEHLTKNPDSLSPPLVNATKRHLSECSALLQKFAETTEKYDASFSTGGSGSKGKDTWRKLKWGSVKYDTREIFRCLQGHIEAVDTLMSTYNTFTGANNT